MGNEKLVSRGKLHVKELDLELTSGFEASGCTFLVTGAYEEENTDFSSKVDILQLGETV